MSNNLHYNAYNSAYFVYYIYFYHDIAVWKNEVVRVSNKVFFTNPATRENLCPFKENKKNPYKIQIGLNMPYPMVNVCNSRVKSKPDDIINIFTRRLDKKRHLLNIMMQKMQMMEYTWLLESDCVHCVMHLIRILFILYVCL